MHTDGPATNPTGWPGAEGSPSRSPDGIRIAFSSDRDGNLEIHTMAADGTGLVQLTHNPVDDVNPSWSPDGRYLSFTSDQTGNSDIYLLRIDGRLLLPLTDNPATHFGASWGC
jgi:Tol biopolymer transport system component